jgi:hypothetical protein
MQMLDYRAIEVSFASFGAYILRDGFFCECMKLPETFVRGSYSFYAILRGEVQASSEIDDRTDNGWGLDFSPRKASPLKRPDRVTLPKVDTWAKPVVGFFAGLKLRTAQ